METIELSTDKLHLVNFVLMSENRFQRFNERIYFIASRYLLYLVHFKFV